MANESEKKSSEPRKVIRFKGGQSRVRIDFIVGRDEVLATVQDLRAHGVDRPSRGDVTRHLIGLLNNFGYGVRDIHNDEPDVATVTLAEYLFPEIVG